MTETFFDRLMSRPIAKSLTEPYHDDPPSRIAYAMGGREWFFETEARAVHRIGLFLGLGWRLPKYVQRPDGIDMVKVFIDEIRGTLTLQFLHCGDRPSEEAEPVKVYSGIPYDRLKMMYEKVIA